MLRHVVLPFFGLTQKPYHLVAATIDRTLMLDIKGTKIINLCCHVIQGAQGRKMVIGMCLQVEEVCEWL